MNVKAKCDWMCHDRYQHRIARRQDDSTCSWFKQCVLFDWKASTLEYWFYERLAIVSLIQRSFWYQDRQNPNQLIWKWHLSYDAASTSNIMPCVSRYTIRGLHILETIKALQTILYKYECHVIYMIWQLCFFTIEFIKGLAKKQ